MSPPSSAAAASSSERGSSTSVPQEEAEGGREERCAVPKSLIFPASSKRKHVRDLHTQLKASLKDRSS